jgi:hypothetical protein
MRRFIALPLAAAVAVLGLSAPAQAAPADRPQDLVEQLQRLLPDDYEQRVADFDRRLGIDDDLSEVARAVLNPGEYECESTELADWLAGTTADWTEADRLGASILLLFNTPMYDALFFPEPERQRFFGLDGEDTTVLQRTFPDLKGFWDIDASGIELLPAHGNAMLDTTRTARVLQVVFGSSPQEAKEAAEAVRELAGLPVYDNGDAPIFTFNAFAYSSEGEEVPGVGLPTDKIVVGDGVLEGFRSIGLGDVAPQAILGHEFGHHIQYQQGLRDSDLPAPEATRRTELMADSFSSYFLAHKRGTNMRWIRIKHFTAAFGNIGDCRFDSPNHHGTPNQRTRAAQWGTLMAVLALPPFFRVIPSRTLATYFDNALPRMVRPDAEQQVELTPVEKNAGRV